MSAAFDDNSTTDTLGEGLLSQWSKSSGVRLPNAAGLVIFNPSASSPPLTGKMDGWGRPMLRIASGSSPSELKWEDLVVATASSQSLPLQDGSAGLVLLNHVVADGREPELEAGCRLLQPGGRLLILGLNRLGFRYLHSRSKRDFPGMRPLAIRARLESLDMRILVMHAAGFFCSERPQSMNSGLWRILIPLADQLLIVAKPAEPRIMNPVSTTKLRAVASPSALAGR